MKPIITVVGDKFEEFARNSGVVSFSQLLAVLEGQSSEYCDVEFELGQGISEQRVVELLAAAKRANRSQQFSFEPLNKCSERHVHKRLLRNSLLTVPRRLEKDLYSASLLIDEESELLTDHIAGQHLPGMVLIEAARQMILAVTEEYYSDVFRGYHAFVWNRLDVAFYGYAFPVKAIVEYQLKSSDASRKSRHRFSASIAVKQGATVPCTVETDFEVFEERVLQMLEQRAVAASFA